MSKIKENTDYQNPFFFIYHVSEFPNGQKRMVIEDNSNQVITKTVEVSYRENSLLEIIKRSLDSLIETEQPNIS